MRVGLASKIETRVDQDVYKYSLDELKEAGRQIQSILSLKPAPYKAVADIKVHVQDGRVTGALLRGLSNKERIIYSARGKNSYGLESGEYHIHEGMDLEEGAKIVIVRKDLGIGFPYILVTENNESVLIPISKGLYRNCIPAYGGYGIPGESARRAGTSSEVIPAASVGENARNLAFTKVAGYEWSLIQQEIDKVNFPVGFQTIDLRD